MHPYALVHGLAISASVLYLSFPERAVAHSSLFPHSSSEILLCFFRCRKECAQERCKRNLVFFWKVFNVLVCCSPVAPANSAGSQSSLLLEKMYARFIWNYWSVQPVNRKQCELKKKKAHQKTSSLEGISLHAGGKDAFWKVCYCK